MRRFTDPWSASLIAWLVVSRIFGESSALIVNRVLPLGFTGRSPVTQLNNAGKLKFVRISSMKIFRVAFVTPSRAKSSVGLNVFPSNAA